MSSVFRCTKNSIERWTICSTSPFLFNVFSRADRPSKSFKLCKQVSQRFPIAYQPKKASLGSLLGRRARQKLDVNREYLVFLEPFFDDTYRPADFREIFYDNELNGLLERTCGLSRTYPFTDGNGNEASLMNKCPPAVSIDCKSDSESNLHVTSYTKPTTTTTTTITATTTTLELPEKDPLDLEALSLLLADNSQESPHSDASFSDGHKSLFSDDAARTNQAKSLSLHMIINLVSLGILHLVS